MWQPINDLERAYQDAHLSIENTVEYFKQMRESILIFLMPPPPSGRTVLQVGNGSSLTFTLWNMEGEDMIPVFTSSARVEEALRAIGKWSEKTGTGEMLGLEFLHLVSLQAGACKIVVNPGCASGARVMDAKMVASIVDGSALVISTPGELAMNGLVISFQDRLPAALRDPLGKFFRTCPAIKAAWLFYEAEPARPHEQVYAVGIVVDGGDAAELKRETALAIESLCPPEWGSRAFLMDEKDIGFTEIMAVVPPFYATPDYKQPVWVPKAKG